MSGCKCDAPRQARCMSCGDMFTPDFSRRVCRECHAYILAEPCPGCYADAGEACREWCLSYVTDSTGQPLEGGE